MPPPNTLPKRRIGQSGPQIPSVGFGLMGISAGYGEIQDDTQRLAVLDRAWELGCTTWDTADIYGDSEDLIGKWFQLHPERRADIFLATKFALKLEPGVADITKIQVDASPEYCRASIEKSLGRLGVPFVDMYYIHRPQTDVPIEKTMEVMKQLLQEGKIKQIGISECSSTTLRRAHAVHPVTAVQVEYNPWDLDIENERGTNLMATCRELGVSIFAYSPFSRGMLTGRYRSPDDFEPKDTRRGYERYQPGNFEKNLVLVDRFAEIAKRKGCYASQLVLAWLLRQGDNVFVIPGTKNVKYLEQNVGGANVELSDEDEKELRRLVEEAEPVGSRVPNFGSYVDTKELLS